MKKEWKDKFAVLVGYKGKVGGEELNRYVQGWRGVEISALKMC